MKNLGRWAESSKKWLIVNGKWLGPLVGVVGTVAAVLLLRPELSFRKDSGSQSIDIKNVGQSGGFNVKAGDGVVVMGQDGDPLYRKAIEALNRNNERLLAENAGLQEQLQRVVLELDLVSDEQGRSETTINEAKRALAEGDTTRAEALYRDHVEGAKAKGAEAIQEMARSYRSLGALAFLRDTDAALDYYLQATRLDPDSPAGWNQLGHLQRRVGEFDEAERSYQRVLKLADGSGDALMWKSIAYGNLGTVYQFRGELDRAIEMYEKALALDKSLGRKEGMASNYGNLGTVYQIRGELDQALEKHEKALALDKEQGHKEGMATAYGNLGTVYRARGDLDRAVEMYEKSLALNEALGRKAGMAIVYGDLGLVYLARGELDWAEEMHEKALELNKSLGSKVGIANQYGNLGTVYRIRGELDRAVEMYEKSLAIQKILGHKEGMASDYGNLGGVYQTRGELNRAVELWQRALVLFTELGSPSAAVVQSWLDSFDYVVN